MSGIRAASPPGTRPDASLGPGVLTATQEGGESSMAPVTTRRRWQWVEEFDICSPRPADYVVAVLAFLLLGLLFVWERNHAIVLNREVFQLQEQLAALHNETDLLSSRATALVDRQLVVRRAEADLGMVFPQADQLSWIYWVPQASLGTQPAPGRVAGFLSP